MSDLEKITPPEAVYRFNGEDLELTEQRDYYVAMHNDVAQKQFFLEGKNAGKQGKPEATELEPIELDIMTFCQVCGISNDSKSTSYNYFKSVVEKLAGRVLWMYDRDNGTETTVRYIDRVIMKRGSGKVIIKLDELLCPYLINLAGNYFQFSIHNIIAMRSSYAIRLYKLLKSYYFRYYKIKFSLDTLKMYLDAGSYNKLSNFKARVLEPALQEINEYTDLKVSAEYEKTGKTVTHVIFTMQELQKPNNPGLLQEHWDRYQSVEAEIEKNKLPKAAPQKM